MVLSGSALADTYNAKFQIGDILRPVKFAENEAGIILKFKHKT